MRERTIFLHGFSKAYAMTGFRIVCLRSTELIEAMMRIHQYSMLCASIISQEAALEAILHGQATDECANIPSSPQFDCECVQLGGLDCHLPRGCFMPFPASSDRLTQRNSR